MSPTSTDLVLWDWRWGPTQAERLCADLLQVEGFTSVDPQCPLGGPDGRKDILCVRDERAWLAAVYFPATRSDRPDVEEKFRHDLEGCARHSRDGFAFFTNQPVTPGERANLASIADPVMVELYHQERIRSLLDSPKGYGLRLQYLRIPMTEEEQYALWSTLGDDITSRLTRQEAGILELHRKVDLVLERTIRLDDAMTGGPSSLESSLLPRLTQFPTADLQIGDVLWIHRLCTDDADLPESTRGRFRATTVWIGQPGSSPETARFVPPPPSDIESLLVDLLSRWRGDYTKALGSDQQERILAIAKFHHGFLSIHPFLDANGRVGRALLQQQLLELTGRQLRAVFSDEPAVYYKALSAADEGDIAVLVKLISSNLE
jgi:hypothetical protein